jgi:hypothetical protein
MRQVNHRLYVILDWTLWDNEIHEGVVDFLEIHETLPCILVANRQTFHAINMRVANSPQRMNILNEEGNPATQGEYPHLAAFTTSDYELTFCVDDTLPEGTFRLIYDSDPVFDTGKEELDDEPLAQNSNHLGPLDNVIPLMA